MAGDQLPAVFQLALLADAQEVVCAWTGWVNGKMAAQANNDHRVREWAAKRLSIFWGDIGEA
jgi:hypothetical protein